jgi:hypothetical protein
MRSPLLGLVAAGLLAGCASSPVGVRSDASDAVSSAHDVGPDSASVSEAHDAVQSGSDVRPDSTSVSESGVESDTRPCSGTAAFCVSSCNTDVGQPAVCVDGSWQCPGGTFPFSNCGPCSGLPPPPNCTCNPSTGARTCTQPDASAAGRPAGRTSPPSRSTGSGAWNLNPTADVPLPTQDNRDPVPMANEGPARTVPGSRRRDRAIR